MSGRLAAALVTAACAVGAGPLLAQTPEASVPASAAERAQAFAELPYWPGYWVSEGQAGTTIGGFAPAREPGAPAPPPAMQLNGVSAPWNEAGRERQAEARARAAGRKSPGWGYPMMMDAATPLQFMITPEETLIINAYGEARHVYTDGRPMPPGEDMWPTVWGTSIGRWEDDTLVIETVQVTNPNEYFHGSAPLSEDARYVERIRLAGDKLVNEMTITDPATLERPWTIQLSYVRDEGFDRMVQMHFENDRTGHEGGFNTIEPIAIGD